MTGDFIISNESYLPGTICSMSVKSHPGDKFEFEVFYRGSAAGEKYVLVEKIISRLKSALKIEDKSELSGDKAYIKFHGTYLIPEDVELLGIKIKSIFGLD